MPRRFGLRHSLVIIWTIGWSDFLLKYRGSVLGYFWSLVSPLVKFVVMLHVFHPFVGQTIPNYSLYLLLGIIIWEHFCYTTSGCMTMLFDKSEVIQRLPFPRLLLILIVGWTQAIVFCSHVLIFLFFAWTKGVPFTADILYLPVLLLQMSLFALGVGMFLSAYCLRFRDIAHLWDIGLQVLFWLTPIAYAYNGQGPLVTDAMRTFSRMTDLSIHTILELFIRFKPLSVLINDARRSALYSTIVGGPSLPHAIVITVFCAAVFTLGATVFQRRSRYFLQEY